MWIVGPSGEWIVDSDGSSKYASPVAQTFGATLQQRRGKALLIAEAPEFLRLLEIVVDQFAKSPPRSSLWAAWLEEARSAIARAKSG